MRRRLAEKMCARCKVNFWSDGKQRVCNACKKASA